MCYEKTMGEYIGSKLNTVRVSENAYFVLITPPFLTYSSLGR